MRIGISAISGARAASEMFIVRFAPRRAISVPGPGRRLRDPERGAAALLLAVPMQWWLVVAVLAAFGFCAPLVNAPMITVLTVRTPAALRPKVLTAVMTISSVVGPLGFLGVGQGLQYVSLTLVFLVVAGSFTLGALAFSAAVRNGDVAGAAAVPEPVG